MASVSPDIVAKKIEPYLDHGERCSLIFLLYDNEDTALQDILLEIQSTRKHVQVLDSALYKPAEKFHEGALVRWARSCVHKDDRWKEKLLESLVIIKNYQIIKILGQSKDDLDTKYLPRQIATSHCVDIVRKALYLLTEDLTNKEWHLIQTNLTSEAKRNQISIPSVYLEIRECFLAYLMSRNILKIKTKKRNMDFAFIISALKSSDLCNWSDKLKALENHINKAEIHHEDDDSKENYKVPNIPRFVLDPVNQGTILIFNMENYDTTTPSNPPLTIRKGSALDCDKFKSTFELLNFEVKQFSDFPSAKVLPEIRSSLKEFCENVKKKKRCFIVAILAHGVKDGFYAIDGKLVQWDVIRQEMRSAGTKDLPRLLVTQACKGILKVPKVVEKDGPSSSSRPGNLLDFFEFSSCVSGFAAFRSPTCGSFYVYSFCKHILLYGRDVDVQSLAALINKELTEKDLVCDGEPVQLTAELTTTAIKKLYLEVPNENDSEARKLVHKWDNMDKMKELDEQKATKTCIPSSCSAVKKKKHESRGNYSKKCTLSEAQQASRTDEIFEALVQTLKQSELQQ